GGQVMILGPIGRNFGAGMTAGSVYLLREACEVENVNLSTVRVSPLGADEVATVRALLARHRDLTGSSRAWRLLSSPQALEDRFLKVEGRSVTALPAGRRERMHLAVTA